MLARGGFFASFANYDANVQAPGAAQLPAAEDVSEEAEKEEEGAEEDDAEDEDGED